MVAWGGVAGALEDHQRQVPSGVVYKRFCGQMLKRVAEGVGGKWWAGSLVVMTIPLHGIGRRFKSSPAHEFSGV